MRILAVLFAFFMLMPVAQSVTVGGVDWRDVVTLDLKTQFGAKCDGSTDDGPALTAAVNTVNTNYKNGIYSTIHIPSGGQACFINSAVTHFNKGVPGGIRGDGPLKSVISVGPAFSGDLFSWDECFGLTPLNTGSYPSNASNGPLVADVTITANNALTTNTQNALMFYDRNDFVLLQNVDIFYFNGAGISMGTALIQPIAYMRESRFYNVKIWNSGTASQPAMLISAKGTSGDATNELSFYGLDIESSNGKGLVINNNQTGNNVRSLRFYGLRIENSTNDQLTIGDTTFTGNVADTTFYGLIINAVPAGMAGLRFTGPNLASGPIGIHIYGGQIGGTGKGISVDASSGEVDYRGGISTTDTNLTVGASSVVAGPVSVDGYGGEYLWSTTIDATSLQGVKLPSLRNGGPLISSIQANIHDGSAGRGNTIPVGANDLQSKRSSATQVASGAQAFIGGGENNTASGGDAVVCGGNTNVAGALDNTACGGANMSMNGKFSGSVGGSQGSDRSDSTFVYATGDISVQGDAQMRVSQHRASMNTGVITRLTTDGAAVAGGNGLRQPGNAAYGTSVDRTICIDTTNRANWAMWKLKQGALVRAAGNSAYTGDASTAATPDQSGGSGSTATLTIGADTSNQQLAVSITWPNTNATDCVSTVSTTEVQ